MNGTREYLDRLVSVYDPDRVVLTRAFQLFAPAVAAQWIIGSEPLLGGARPIDVLALRGIAPVIEALNAIEDGAYA
jgi:hypothetical protein